MAKNHQLRIFWMVCFVCFLVLAKQISVVLPLYTDAAFRQRTRAILQATALREGWMFSGLSIRSINRDTAMLHYRSYMRGSDPVSCHLISFSSGTLSPCPSE